MKKSIIILVLGLMTTLGAQVVNAESKVYASLSTDNKTITFYYGEKKNPADVAGVENWLEWNSEKGYSVTTIVMDESMKSARPASTQYWFSQFRQLTEIQHLDYLNTSEVTDMEAMFYECVALPTIDVSGFDTKQVTMMRDMFYMCKAVKTLDVSNFDTKKVTNMTSMFSWCQALTSLDLRDLNMSNVENIAWMFSYSDALTTIYCNKDWSENAKLSVSENAFMGCTALKGEDGTKYNESHIDVAYARPDDPTNSKPGYFTKKAQTKEMTPTIAHLAWDETDKQWSITAYEYAGEDPKYVFVFSVDGAKNVIPNVMALTNSADDNFVFTDTQDFGGTIKDATISITYEGTGYLYDNVGGLYYVNAKISGEMSDADGNKLVVKEPTNFIKVFVPSDIATGIEGIQSTEYGVQKVLKDGQIFILRDGKTYTTQGQEVK